MSSLHARSARPAFDWDACHTRTAWKASQSYAARRARHAALQQADREDLQQDILLAAVERARHFACEHASWGTYVALLARHVIADRCRAEARRSAPVVVPLDAASLELSAGVNSVTQPERCDAANSIAFRIGLQALIDDLPARQRETLRLLLETSGDVAAAHRRSGRSSSAFYRDVCDLRLWLLASGLVVVPRGRGKNRRVGW
jgi:DNA-directed RNA polymerase specialized sigma24 family protein